MRIPFFLLAGALVPGVGFAQSSTSVVPLRPWSLGANPLVVLAISTQQTGQAAGTALLTGGPAFEGFGRYERPDARWYAELAAGMGLYAAHKYDAAPEVGRSGSTTLLGFRTAARAGYALPLGRAGYWRLRPHAGLTLARLAPGQSGRHDPQPLIYNNPAAGQTQQFETVTFGWRLGYEAGLVLARRLGPDHATELGLTVRYANSLSGRAVASTTFRYDRAGVPQPEIRSISRLEAVMIGLSLSRPLRARS